MLLLNSIKLLSFPFYISLLFNLNIFPLTVSSGFIHKAYIYIYLTSNSSPRSSFYGLSSVSMNYYYYMTCDMKFTTANKIHPIILLFQESQQLLHCSIMRLPSPSPAPPLVGLLPLSLGGRMGL